MKMVNILLEETPDGHLGGSIRGEIKVIEALAAAYTLLAASADADPDPDIATARDQVLAIIRRGGLGMN